MNHFRILAIAVAVTIMAATACAGGGGDEENRAPVIHEGLALLGGDRIEAGASETIQVLSVSDPDGDPLAYVFAAVVGEVDPKEPTGAPSTTYTAPNFAGEDTVTVTITDAKGGVTTASLRFNVVAALDPTANGNGGQPTPGGNGGPSVEITGPADDSTVPSAVLVEGTASNLEEGTVLWTVVHIDGLFWPQREALLVGGEWSAQAFIGGGPQDSGKKFDLLAVSVDSSGTNIFTDWLDTGENTGEYPGFSSLPANAQIGDRITVTLE